MLSDAIPLRGEEQKEQNTSTEAFAKNVDGCALYCAQTSELEKVLWRSSAFDLDPLAMIYDPDKAVCEQKVDRIVMVKAATQHSNRTAYRQPI